MDLKAQFEKASQDVKTLPDSPSNEVLLKLYAFFKQASSGDATGKRPGMLDIRGRAKFDAWTKLSGSSSDEAMQGYVDLVNELLG